MWKRAAANQKASWRKPKRSGFPSRLFQMFSDAISDWLPCNGCSCRLATAPENKTINQPLSVAVRGVTLEPLGVLCSARRRSKQLQLGLEDRKTGLHGTQGSPSAFWSVSMHVRACPPQPAPAARCQSSPGEDVRRRDGWHHWPQQPWTHAWKEGHILLVPGK